MAYDGDTFTVLDDAIVYSADNEPVDVFAEQALRNNAYYLNIGRNPATLTLFQGDVAFSAEDVDYTFDRPWCSPNDYSTVIRTPIWLSAGLRQVALSMLYRVEVPFPAIDATPTTGGTIYYQLILRDPNSRVMQTLSGELARTQDVGLGQREAIYKMATLTLTITGSAEGWGTLEFRIKSEMGADSGTTIAFGVSGNGSRIYTTTNGSIGFGGSPPTRTSPDLFVLKRPNVDEFFEVFGVVPNSTDPEDVWVFPSFPSTSGETLSVYWATYMQCRSAQIDLIYANDSISPQPLSGLAALEPVRSRQFFSHAFHPLSAYKRPRLIAFGPPGYRPTRLESWPSGYHTRWPIVSATTAADIIDESITLDADGNACTIDITIDLIATVLSNLANLETGTSEWTLTATLYEFDVADNSWATPTTVSTVSLTDELLVTFPVPDASSYFWANEVHSRFQYSKRILHDSAAAPEDWQFPHREGQLYAEDSQLIQRATLTLDASAISSNNAQLRLVVSATYTASSLAGFDDQAFYGTTATTDRLQLTNVGYSVTQRRDL
jgi:hypothetical protein